MLGVVGQALGRWSRAVRLLSLRPSFSVM